MGETKSADPRRFPLKWPMKTLTLLAVLIAAHGYSERISDSHHMAILFFNAKITSFLRELSLENLLTGTMVNESASSQAEFSWLSQDCLEDLTILANGITKIRNFDEIDRELVIPALDSTGKIGSGITRGHTTFSGLYQQCAAIDYLDETKGHRIQGGYFRVAFYVPVFNTTVNINWDVCLPKSCSKCDLRSALRSVPKIGKFIGDVSDGFSKMPKLVFASYIVGTMMLVMIVLCLLAGAIDYYNKYVSRRDRNGTLYEILMVFSIYRNFCELMAVNRLKKRDQISTVNCIRSVSIIWVVTLHTLLPYLSGDNTLDVKDMFGTYIGQIFSNGYFSVDSFFFIGGLLLAFQVFKDTDRIPHAYGVRYWIMFYLHRIIRLSPPYYAVILFYTFIYTSWAYDLSLLLRPQFTADYCRSLWWTNILYLNNFIGYKNMCYIVSWYLATDFQIYVFTPILILPLTLAGTKVGVIVAVVVLAISTGLNAFQVIYFHLPASEIFFAPTDPLMRDLNDYQLWNYYNPYIRCQVVIIGFLTGYLLRKKKTMHIHKLVNLTLWMAAFVMMGAALFGLKDWVSGHQWPVHIRAVYTSLSRMFWGLGLSWIVIACYYGYGGLVNTVMSWPVWSPMARLSYCVYLIHLMVIVYMYGIDYSPIIYSGIPQFLLHASLPIVVLSFVAAAFWSCVFEIPFVKLEAKLLGRRRRPHVSAKQESPLQIPEMLYGSKNNA